MTAHRARDSHPSDNGAVALGAEFSISAEDAAATIGRARLGEGETGRLTEVMIRLLDILGATFLFILLAPVLLVVAVAIKLDSAGPSIYRQRRLGRNLEQFSVAKFRTMREGSGADAHRHHVQRMISGANGGARPMTKLSEDDRVTRVGAFLRRSSIDELPQLWNVLRGEMSLVGPRPPIEYEVEKYPSRAFRRFAVKPGITGLWQVRGRSLLTFDQMIALDTEYVERRSLALNLKILLLTLPTVVHGRGAG